MTEEVRRGFTRAGARDKLFELICANARVLHEDLADEKNLKEDLNLDSFDSISIVTAMEADFDIAISDEDALEFQTVRDVCDELWRKLA
jgi:acyl carrier protein